MERIVLPKVRNLGQTIGDPFVFVRQHFGFFIRVFTYFGIPPLLFAAGSFTFWLKEFFEHKYNTTVGYSYFEGSGYKGAMTYLLVTYAIFSITSILQQILITEFVVLNETETGVTLRRVLKQVKTDWKNIAATFITLVIMGALACVIVFLLLKSAEEIGDSLAGLFTFLFLLILFVIFFPLNHVFYIRLRERLNVFRSIGKAFTLTSGSWWKTFIAFIICGIVLYFVFSFLSLPFSVVVKLFDMHQAKTYYTSGSEAFVYAVIGASSVFLLLGSFFIGNFYFVFFGFNYYSLSERYDNFRLRAEIESIGTHQDVVTSKQEGEY